MEATTRTTDQFNKMEDNKFFYTEEEYTANKCDLADAFVALHLADGLSQKQRDVISHCLSLLNDFLEAMHDGKTFVYEPFKFD